VERHADGRPLDRRAGLVRQPELERGAAGRHQRLKDGLLGLYLDSLRRHGCTMGAEQVAQLLAVDLELSAQGMGVWLDRDSRPRA
jgi:hypothetical protein